MVKTFKDIATRRRPIPLAAYKAIGSLSALAMLGLIVAGFVQGSIPLLLAGVGTGVLTLASLAALITRRDNGSGRKAFAQVVAAGGIAFGLMSVMVLELPQAFGFMLAGSLSFAYARSIKRFTRDDCHGRAEFTLETPRRGG
jgi:hypothetical protein